MHIPKYVRIGANLHFLQLTLVIKPSIVITFFQIHVCLLSFRALPPLIGTNLCCQIARRICVNSMTLIDSR